MSVGTAASNTVETVSDHPSLAVYAGLTGLLLSLSGNLSSFVGEVGGGVSLFLSFVLLLITPFLMGGLVGLVSTTREGQSPSFAQFRKSGVENYIPLILMTIVLIVGAFIFGFLAVLLLLIPVVNFIILFLLIPVSFGAMAILQFVDVSIIVGSSGPLETFSDSYELVRDNFVSVLGYILARWMVSIVGGIPMFYLILSADLTDPAAIDSMMASPAMVGAVLFSGVIGGLMYIFHTMYYRSLVGLE